MSWRGLTFVFLVVCVDAGADKYVFQCNQSSVPKKESLPTDLLPANFSAVVRYTHWNATAYTALIEEISLPYQHWLKKTNRNGTRSVGIGKFNVTFNETMCTGFSDSSAIEHIYVTHEVVAKALNFHGLSISELVDRIRQRNFTQQIVFEEPYVVGGVEGIKWVGCDNVTENGAAVQIEVTYAGPFALNPYASSLKNPLVLSIHVLLFNVTSKETSMLSHTSFDIVEIETPSGLENKMPHGLFCNGMPFEKVPPTFPRKFEASFSYSQIGEKSPQDLEVFYNGEERFTAFRVDANKGEEIPFLGKLSAAGDRWHLTLVHDFNYGLEYQVNEDSGVCEPVTAINRSFGDVSPVNGTEFIDMKMADELFLNLAHSPFYYAGKQVESDSSSLHVYVSQASLVNGTKVVELYFDGADAVKPGFLHSIVQYHKDSLGKEVKRVLVRLNSFRDLNLTKSAVLPFSVQSCLKFDHNSSLYVKIKSTSVSDLAKSGFSRVKAALLNAIAASSNISTLRISDIFLKDSESDVLALFSVSAKSGVTAAKTKDRKDEIALEEAIATLNATLSKGDFPVVVTESKKLMISQSTLRLIPEDWSPIPVPSYQGYSGGSMFVLAIFMLLLGAAIGVAIVLFLWKRQRIGSLAYQVFE